MSGLDIMSTENEVAKALADAKDAYEKQMQANYAAALALQKSIDRPSQREIDHMRDFCAFDSGRTSVVSKQSSYPTLNVGIKTQPRAGKQPRRAFFDWPLAFSLLAVAIIMVLSAAVMFGYTFDELSELFTVALIDSFGA